MTKERIPGSRRIASHDYRPGTLHRMRCLYHRLPDQGSRSRCEQIWSVDAIGLPYLICFDDDRAWSTQT